MYILHHTHAGHQNVLWQPNAFTHHMTWYIQTLIQHISLNSYASSSCRALFGSIQTAKLLPCYHRLCDMSNFGILVSQATYSHSSQCCWHFRLEFRARSLGRMQQHLVTACPSTGKLPHPNPARPESVDSCHIMPVHPCVTPWEHDMYKWTLRVASECTWRSAATNASIEAVSVQNI